MVARRVTALERCFRILDLLASSDQPLSISEIARVLNLPRTSLHELVATMVAWSYVEPVPSTLGRFRLGLRLFEMGSQYASHLDVLAEAEAVAREVSAVSGETAHVAVLDGSDVVYIAKVDSPHTVRMVSAVGTRLPSHCTGVGKALLAQLPEDELRRRYRSDTTLKQMTPNSHSTILSLWADLEQVRARGTAYDNCESNLDVRCIAAPVFGPDGNAIAALSISAPISRWTDECYERYSQLALGATRSLSKRLGYRTATRNASA